VTGYSLEHVFRAPETATVLAAYFDLDHLTTQDRLVGLTDRTVVASTDDGARLRTSWRVASAEQLPLFVRPFVAGGRLRYVETMTWRRDDDVIELLVQPDVLGGRVQITGEYRLTKLDEGRILGRYHCNVSVAIKLLSEPIERAIAERIVRDMPVMMACTQRWLDRTSAR
jgi:hypothetical protein